MLAFQVPIGSLGVAGTVHETDIAAATRRLLFGQKRTQRRGGQEHKEDESRPRGPARARREKV